MLQDLRDDHVCVLISAPCPGRRVVRARLSVTVAVQPWRRGPLDRAGNGFFAVVGCWCTCAAVTGSPCTAGSGTARRLLSTGGRQGKAARPRSAHSASSGSSKGAQRSRASLSGSASCTLRAGYPQNTRLEAIGLPEQSLQHGDAISLIFGWRCADLDQDQTHLEHGRTSTSSMAQRHHGGRA